MAKKQTRRGVSLNRDNYEAVRQEATRRGMTITALVEYALGAIGVPIVAHPQQSLERVQRVAAVKAARAQGGIPRQVARPPMVGPGVEASAR